MRIKHTHSSGKWNAAANLLHAAVLRYVKWANLMTFTEVDSESREHALKVDGFDVSAGDHGLKDDSAVVWDNTLLKAIHEESYRVGTKLFRIGSHLSSPLYARIVVLEELGTGVRFVVAACHFPSGVEGDLYHKRHTARVIAWLQATHSLRRRVNKLKRKYKCKGAIISADWNTNFKKKWARVLVKVNFPKWSLVWSKVKKLPKRGTHGLRLIDGAVLKGFRVITAFVDDNDNSSDHVPWSEELTL
jgi:hypothetical protein